MKRSRARGQGDAMPAKAPNGQVRFPARLYFASWMAPGAIWSSLSYRINPIDGDTDRSHAGWGPESVTTAQWQTPIHPTCSALRQLWVTQRKYPSCDAVKYSKTCTRSTGLNRTLALNGVAAARQGHKKGSRERPDVAQADPMSSLPDTDSLHASPHELGGIPDRKKMFRSTRLLIAQFPGLPELRPGAMLLATHRSRPTRTTGETTGLHFTAESHLPRAHSQPLASPRPSQLALTSRRARRQHAYYDLDFRK